MHLPLRDLRRRLAAVHGECLVSFSLWIKAHMDVIAFVDELVEGNTRLRYCGCILRRARKIYRPLTIQSKMFTIANTAYRLVLSRRPKRARDVWLMTKDREEKSTRVGLPRIIFPTPITAPAGRMDAVLFPFSRNEAAIAGSGMHPCRVDIQPAAQELSSRTVQCEACRYLTNASLRLVAIRINCRIDTCRAHEIVLRLVRQIVGAQPWDDLV